MPNSDSAMLLRRCVVRVRVCNRVPTVRHPQSGLPQGESTKMMTSEGVIGMDGKSKQKRLLMDRAILCQRYICDSSAYQGEVVWLPGGQQRAVV